jgi:hypothetical protein
MAKQILGFPSALIVWSICATAHAAIIYDPGALAFESTGQSMWDSGTAFQQSASTFIGSTWTATATIGGIAGSADAVVIPALGAVTVPVFEPRIFVPTPTWSNPLAGYFTGCNCWRDVTIKPATGAVTADTRTGAELDVTTSGRAGIEFGYSIDSGSVDAAVNFQALATLPDVVNTGEFFSLGTDSTFDSGTIATQSPTIQAYINAVMQLSGSVDATACALTFGCAEGSFALPTVDMNQSILSFDPNSIKILDGLLPDGSPLAEIPILNRGLKLEGGATIEPPVVGFKLTGPLGGTIVSTLPPTPSVTVDLAEATLNIPNIATNGTGSGSSITSSGRDDLLSLQLDIDGAATLFAGLPPLGANVDLIDSGPFKLGVSLDFIDVDAGPVLGVTQDFELEPTLIATLAFSNPVQIAGMSGLQSSWTGRWSDLPQLAISDTTTVTPTFSIQAMLTNDLGLDLGLVGTLDILKLGVTGLIGGVPVLKSDSISLNNLLGIGNTLFETSKLGLSVYDKSFQLGGFNQIAGLPFTLVARTVPEPGTIWLLLCGLIVLLIRHPARSATRSSAA